MLSEKISKSPSAMLALLNDEKAIKRSRFFECCRVFKEKREDISDNAKCSSLKTQRTDANVRILRNLNRWIRETFHWVLTGCVWSSRVFG